MRAVAFELLRRVFEDDAYANLLLPKLLVDAKVDSRDAGFIQELSFGALRNKLLYEKIIEVSSSRAVSSIDSNALVVLLLGAHQLIGMRVPAHAAINESVNLAKSQVPKSAVGFVNAVLRRISVKTREQWIDQVLQKVESIDERLSLKYSHPIWIVRSLKAALESRGLGESLEDLLIADNTPAKVSVAALPGFVTAAELSQFGALGVASPISVELGVTPSNVPAVMSGHARVQDQGSQLAVLALTESEIEIDDSLWLDMCAGPGGKAALMSAIAVQKNVKFEANEISPHRAKLVEGALRPISSVRVSVGDGREIGGQGARFSRILLDAPCTGLGALRRRPESRWRKNASDISDLSKLQRDLLLAAWEALLPGGVLGYVTCSPHLSETTAQVSWVENKFGKGLELLPVNTILNGVNSSLGLDESFKTAQLWPHKNGTDAMFIALFRKKVNS
jgi:16S rRNA (cytosine967-C5)-methyltransferase